jgi:lysylphosphatidylglycerol synthetase-like protein (DUF2156 family)
MEEPVMQLLYLIAAILGAVVPLSYLFPFLATNGLDLPLIFKQLFQNNISAFFGVDVIISALTLWLFVYAEGHRQRMKHLWVFILCTLLVGVSLGLPLFLFFRERKLNAERHA